MNNMKLTQEERQHILDAISCAQGEGFYVVTKELILKLMGDYESLKKDYQYIIDEL